MDGAHAIAVNQIDESLLFHKHRRSCYQTLLSIEQQYSLAGIFGIGVYHRAVIVGCVSLANRFGEGMIGGVFTAVDSVDQELWASIFRSNELVDLQLAGGESTGLVKDHRLHLPQHVKIDSALEDNPFAGSLTDSHVIR